ncbi:unnamed protein product, partial [Laminaria digitata]
NGKHDTGKAVEDYKQNAMLMSALNRFADNMKTGKIDEGTTIANLLIDKHINTDARMLNAVAWMLLNADDAQAEQFKVGHRAAATACEVTEWKDWSILDTYALAASKNGMHDEAIKWQTKAIELVPAQNTEAKSELKSRLDDYEAAKDNG